VPCQLGWSRGPGKLHSPFSFSPPPPPHSGTYPLQDAPADARATTVVSSVHDSFAFLWIGTAAKCLEGGKVTTAIAGHEFYTLSEVQEFLRENCASFLSSASGFAGRRIRQRCWHQDVPEPEEIAQIVLEKYWSGSRRMRKSLVPREQIYLAIASVLSNLARNSGNRHAVSVVSLAAREDSSTPAGMADFEDELMTPPDVESANREERTRLLNLLQGHELDQRVMEFILDRSETSSREFKHAVRPRAIARELCVPRHEIYKSLERMRKLLEPLQAQFRKTRYLGEQACSLD
jgi:hypothetical protein